MCVCHEGDDDTWNQVTRCTSVTSAFLYDGHDCKQLDEMCSGLVNSAFHGFAHWSKTYSISG